MTTTRTGHLTYTVTSETDESKCYQVSLEFNSCSCPHHLHRKAICKHITTAQTMEKAREIKDEKIAALFFKYEETKPQVAAVILAEIERRQGILEAQEELKRLFA